MKLGEKEGELCLSSPCRYPYCTSCPGNPFSVLCPRSIGSFVALPVLAVGRYVRSNDEVMVVYSVGHRVYALRVVELVVLTAKQQSGVRDVTGVQPYVRNVS